MSAVFPSPAARPQLSVLPQPALLAGHDASDVAEISLAQLPLGRRAWVTAVRATAQSPDWAQALDDLGFLPGEVVQLLVRGLPGGDPLVVRVGTSTYALRGAEAGCIWVRPA